MNIKCQICKKQFHIPYCRYKKAKYCSYKCYWISKKGQIPISPFKKGHIPWNKHILKRRCKICNKIFIISPYRKNNAKYCSYKCYWKSKKGKRNSIKTEYKFGKNHPNWKGGRVRSGGRIYILYPSHPFANTFGYISEHRLIAEKYLKRFLMRQEIVHHIDGNPSNNTPENLYVFNSNSSHQIFHKNRNKTIQLKSNII